jgi:hypothetical protein
MKKILVGAIALALGAGAHAFAQSLDDLNIQIHGYATQGFLYTTNNNMLTTHSSDGSPAWTEAVLNRPENPFEDRQLAMTYTPAGLTLSSLLNHLSATDYRGAKQDFGRLTVPAAGKMARGSAG